MIEIIILSSFHSGKSLIFVWFLWHYSQYLSNKLLCLIFYSVLHMELKNWSHFGNCFKSNRTWMNKWILNCLITVSSKKKKKKKKKKKRFKNDECKQKLQLWRNHFITWREDCPRVVGYKKVYKNWKLKNTENCFKRAFLGLDDNTVLKEENKIIKTKKSW